MNRSELVKAAPLMAGGFWWAPPELPGYLVSAEGNVISFRQQQPRLLKPIRMGQYRGLQLSTTNGLKKKYVHRLVLESFVGPAPKGHETAHRNGIRDDNRLGNLNWTTPIQNAVDKKLHGTSGAGERNSMAKLTVGAVNEMRLLRSSTGLSYARIGRKFNVSQMTAYRAIVGQSWSKS